MFSNLNKLSFDNEAKIRRQLISISVLLLIFKNLHLDEDQNTLKIFELGIVVSQPAIIGAITFVFYIALIAFFLLL